MVSNTTTTTTTLFRVLTWGHFSPPAPHEWEPVGRGGPSSQKMRARARISPPLSVGFASVRPSATINRVFEKLINRVFEKLTSLFISSSHQQQIGRVPLGEPSLDPSLADLLAVRLEPTLPTLPMRFPLPAGTPHCFRCAVVTNGPSSSSLAMNVDTGVLPDDNEQEQHQAMEEDSDSDGFEEESEDDVDEQEQPQPQPQQMPPAPMKKPKKKQRTDEEVNSRRFWRSSLRSRIASVGGGGLEEQVISRASVVVVFCV